MVSNPGKRLISAGEVPVPNFLQMEIIKIKPAGKISGIVSVPGDKSISHRIAIIGSLADGVIDVSGFLCSADCLATLTAVQALGVEVEGAGTPELKIHGVGLRGLKKPAGVLDLGNSGTGLRLLTGLVSGCPFDTELTGDESLRKRPMMRIIKPLTRMGTVISGIHCPLKIQGGHLRGIDYMSPVASAQVKSCVLIAGILAEKKTRLTEPVKSRDHTERLLSYLGADIKVDGLTVTVTGGVRLQARPVTVPGDISSAVFILAAPFMVPEGEVTVRGVGFNPTRTGIIGILTRMGADIKISPKDLSMGEPVASIQARKSALKGIDITAGEIPGLIDELPLIAVLATQAKGTTIVSGAEELRVKESDRIRNMAINLNKMGAAIEEKRDGWIIEGGRPLKGAVVSGFGDHRIAMAMVIAGLGASGATVIEGTEWINTSFPGFMDVIDKIRL